MYSAQPDLIKSPYYNEEEGSALRILPALKNELVNNKTFEYILHYMMNNNVQKSEFTSI